MTTLYVGKPRFARRNEALAFMGFAPSPLDRYAYLRMTVAQQIGEFALRASFERISEQARNRLKVHILDTLGCAIGALDGPPIRCAHEQVKELGGNEQCTMIGGGKTAVDRAAFFNSALVRY